MEKRWLLVLSGIVLFILAVFMGINEIARAQVGIPLQILGVFLVLLGITNFFQISTWLKILIAVISAPVLYGVFFYLMIMFVPK